MADSGSTSSAKPPLILYALTVFWGAFLLFLVQPLIGKYILPWFGGTPGVWTTCLLFFQCLLLAGYAYAHCLNQFLPPRKQVWVHGCLLLLAVCTLPITPNEGLKPDGEGTPVWAILKLLGFSLGIPYLILSSTGPLVQAWFARAYTGASPYRLYALSNVGSLLALVAYPFVVEPWSTRTEQVNGWSWGMGFYAVCCGLLVWRMRDVPEMASDKTKVESAITETRLRRAGVWLCWLVLPACGTALLMATTNKLCQDVAVVPFLWVLPLALYLISFIISFDSPRWYVREIYVPLLVVCWIGVLWGMGRGVDLEIVLQVGLYSAALFISCMVCHGELYRLRPEPARLTQYFLGVAAGGALGGLAVAVLAPRWFDGYWEYHIALWSTGLLYLLVQCVNREPWALGKWHVRGLLGLCWTVVCMALLRAVEFSLPAKLALTWLPLLFGWAMARYIAREWWFGRSASEGRDFKAGVAGVVLTCLALYWVLKMSANWSEGGSVSGWSALQPGIWVAVGLMTLNLFVWLSVRQWKGVQIAWGWQWLGLGPALVVVFVGLLKDIKKSEADAFYVQRNFYGTLKISRYSDLGGEVYRLLLNGHITHGFQYESVDWCNRITSYYTYGSGVELAMRYTPEHNKRVGVVGLGVGTMAGFAEAGDRYWMYDINPAVVDLSADDVAQFTYCINARDRGAFVEIVPGDARLAMERELHTGKNRKLDVLVLDAFSSDSIPVHLLTLESLKLYDQHLKTDGVLAVHISNRYLNLEPVVRRLAAELDFGMIEVDSLSGEDYGQDWVYAATWVLLSRNQDFLNDVEANAWLRSDLSEAEELPLWTDDYASIFRIMNKPQWWPTWLGGGND